MARALRRPGLRSPGLAAALAALVAVSTLLHWLAVRRHAGLWIMPDEAIYGTRALRLWQHGVLPVLHGQGAGYSVLYPVVAGGPLSIGSIATGYAWAKAAQALVMSLAAVPVVLYGRRLMPARYAFVAAALTVASPLVLFAGYLMTEVVYYPLAAATLLAIARAVETARPRDQAIAFVLLAAAVATRVQAGVLLAVFAAAVLVDAALARRRPRVRAFWPVWVLLGAASLAAAAAPGLLGAYSSTLSGGYPAGRALRLVFDHFAYVVPMVGVVPAAATVVMIGLAARGRERDPAVRALLSVTAAAVPLVVVQVGVFASRYSPHLLGRDLAALPPPLFLCFALWLARGAPRPRFLASLATVGVLAVVVAAPWNDLAVNALPDSMGLGLVARRFAGAGPQTVVALGVAVLLVGFRFVPRRLAATLAVALLALFVATSVVSSNLVRDAVTAAQVELVGTPRDWIGRAVGDAPVAYLYDGDTSGWPVVWQQQFWNPQIDRVVSLAPASVPGPIGERVIAVPHDGVLPIGERYVVANDTVTMRGVAIAHQSRGIDAFGLTLWRLPRTPRLSTIETDFRPNGDIVAPASVTVFDCAGGSLQLTLLPKETDVLQVFLDGRRVLDTHIAGAPSYHTTIPVPSRHAPGACRFTIAGDALLGSTVVAFSRPG